jgi:hypothetical protein
VLRDGGYAHWFFALGKLALPLLLADPIAASLVLPHLERGLRRIEALKKVLPNPSIERTSSGWLGFRILQFVPDGPEEQRRVIPCIWLPSREAARTAASASALHQSNPCALNRPRIRRK